VLQLSHTVCAGLCTPKARLQPASSMLRWFAVGGAGVGGGRIARGEKEEHDGRVTRPRRRRERVHE
jgi:hypothetical protein